MKISATFYGKCDLCGNFTIVFKIGDEKSKKTLTLCKKCANKLGNMRIKEVVEKYGTISVSSFEKGVKKL